MRKGNLCISNQPERVTSVGKVTCAADIWSLGLTLIEAAIAKFPYSLQTPLGINSIGIMDMYEMIVQEPSPSLPGTFSPELRELVDVW